MAEGDNSAGGEKHRGRGLLFWKKNIETERE